MTITLTLAPEEEAQLQARAAQQGLPTEEYIGAVLRHEFQRDAPLPGQDEPAKQDKPAKTVAEMLQGRIGHLSSRDANNGQASHTAEQTGQEFAKMLAEKYRKQGLDL